NMPGGGSAAGPGGTGAIGDFKEMVGGLMKGLNKATKPSSGTPGGAAPAIEGGTTADTSSWFSQAASGVKDFARQHELGGLKRTAAQQATADEPSGFLGLTGAERDTLMKQGLSYAYQ